MDIAIAVGSLQGGAWRNVAQDLEDCLLKRFSEAKVEIVPVLAHQSPVLRYVYGLRILLQRARVADAGGALIGLGPICGCMVVVARLLSRRLDLVAITNDGALLKADGSWVSPFAIKLGILRMLARVLYPRASVVTCTSEAVLNSIAGKHGTAIVEKAELIPNPINRVRIVEAADTGSPFCMTAPVFGYVGRMGPEKRPALAIEALAVVAKCRPDASILVVGDGPLLPTVRELAERLGLRARIVFAGRRVNPYPLISGLAALVIPSESEGFSLVAHEALILGVPVVAADDAVLPHCFHLHPGLSLASPSAEAMGQQLLVAAGANLPRAEQPACVEQGNRLWGGLVERIYRSS